jgi:hypothetical protein
MPFHRRPVGDTSVRLDLVRAGGLSRAGRAGTRVFGRRSGTGMVGHQRLSELGFGRCPGHPRIQPV